MQWKRIIALGILTGLILSAAPVWGQLDNIKPIPTMVQEEVRVEEKVIECIDAEQIGIYTLERNTDTDNIIEESPLIYTENNNHVFNRWNIELTMEEFIMYAKIVMLEAGGESDTGQQAVAECILNRMVSEYYGGSLYQVLSAEGQFTSWKNLNIAVPSDRVYMNITKVLAGETNILPFETLYFSQTGVGNSEQITIGNHVFCN